MVGNKETLKMAKMGKRVAENLPQGGTKVWQDLMAFLEQRGMILDTDQGVD